MSLTEEAQRRGCYCGVWDTNPGAYQSLGYPHGYCGFCQACGRPGHTRHFPGPVPYTGCWCDFHYRLTAWLDPRAGIGCFLWLAVLMSGLLALVWQFKGHG
jgi:hypothetical protein